MSIAGTQDRRPALSLVEAIVTVAIVSLLFALAVPAIQRVRLASMRAACAANLREVSFGVHGYVAVHRTYPEGCAYPYLREQADLVKHVGVSWQTAILPFVEQGSTWEAAMAAHKADPVARKSSLHAAVEARVVPVFLCPMEGQSLGGVGFGDWGVTSYLGVAGTDRRRGDGIFHKALLLRPADVTDGTSNTLMVGERPAGPEGVFSSWYAAWGFCICSHSQILHAGDGRWQLETGDCHDSTGTFRPGSVGNLCDVNHYWSLHPGGANFAFADGSVRFVSYSSQSLVPLLATRAGGEPVSLD